MHAMTHAPSAPARQRWMFLAVLLTIAALILSACGAKIETQLGECREGHPYHAGFL